MWEATAELAQATRKKLGQYADEIACAGEELVTPLQHTMAGADEIPPTSTSKPNKISESESPIQLAKPERTKPSLSADTTREPRGVPEKMPTSGTDDSIRGHIKQEETAKLLAEKGYDIELQPKLTAEDKLREPSLNTDKKKPDFRIEGKIFDSLAIKENPLVNPSNLAANIRRSIEKKVGAGQTTRLVLNLDDSKVSLSELKQILLDTPIDNLNEIIIVRNGTITHFFPFE